MDVQSSLTQIKPTWLTRAARQLAKGNALRQTLQGELARFFDLLLQSWQSGDPGWLDSLLQDWASTPTESDLEDQNINLAPFIKTLSATFHETVRDSLPPEEGLELVTELAPYFLYSLEKAALYESQGQIEHVSRKLLGIQEEMARLDESKSKFISVAAHELKTPITLIEGYAAMLHNILEHSGYKHPQLETLLNGIHNGIHRLREIVDDMIDVSLIDNDMLMLNLQPVWAAHLIELLRNDLEESIRTRHQALTIKRFNGDNEIFFADPERIYQAFRNILLNAIKYTPDGGRITISGRLLPGFIEIIISDTGIGIAPENQTLIFEKFYQLGKVQLHSSGKTKFKGGGPGLGLPIARGIIEAHGGTIWVESEGYDEEKCPGATFHILLPIRKEADNPQLNKLFQKASAQQNAPQENTGDEASH